MTPEILIEEVGAELVKVEGFNAVAAFTGGGMGAVLSKIEETVRAIPLDPSTIAGRDQIRSVAYKVARTKTTLDAEGKKLTEEWRKNTTLVNAERKKATERLDILADEVRRPLTEFENKEKNRVAAHEECLAEMAGVLTMLQNSPDMDVALLTEHLLDFSELHKDRNWEEFGNRAALTKRDVSLTLIARIEARRKHDTEQAELARLRKEELERQQRERDEAIARQAAETARIRAERETQEVADAERRRIEAVQEAERKRVAAEAEKLRAENERVQREAKEREEKARREHEHKLELARQERAREELSRLAAEKRAKEAEEAKKAAALKAEADRLAAEEKAAADLKAAQEKAKRDQAEALRRQRERAERERKAVEDARLKREADEANRLRVHREIHTDLLANWTDDKLDLLVADDIAMRLADAIMAGKVRNVKVQY